MARRGRALRTGGGRRRKKTQDTSRHHRVVGTIEISKKGSAVVHTCDEGDIFVKPHHVHEAMDGDTVTLRVWGGMRPQGRVINVLHRAHTTFLARYEEAYGGELKVLVALDDRLAHDFLVVESPDAHALMPSPIAHDDQKNLSEVHSPHEICEGDTSSHGLPCAEYKTVTQDAQRPMNESLSQAAQACDRDAGRGTQQISSENRLDGAQRQGRALCPSNALGATHAKRISTDQISHGDIVRACICRYPSMQQPGTAFPIEVVGKASDKDLLMKTVLAAHGFTEAFPERCMLEAEELTLDVDDALAQSHRKDLRSLTTLTIDPVDAKDFDDALSIIRTPTHTTLYVHIADVSAYVRAESSLDLEARSRATSVYLADRVVPMLPEELSNYLCSLVPHEPRLAVTVEMTCNLSGKITQVQVYKSVIESNDRLCYEAVDRVLSTDNNEKSFTLNPEVIDHKDAALDTLPSLRAPRDSERWATADKTQECIQQMYARARHYTTELHALATLARNRVALRKRRGAILFDTAETKVVLDEDGQPQGVRTRSTTPATSLVEEAMLMANESVAELLSQHELQAAYRIHEAPHPDRLVELLPILHEFSLDSPQAVAALASGDPFGVQELVEKTAGKPESYVVNQLLIRGMKRAHYAPHNAGHYALGADWYAHFTSPIRRYPDLIVHRVLTTLIGRLHPSERRGYARMIPALPAITDHCSKQEREAAAAEWESQAIMIAQYMKPFVGTQYHATVVHVESFGCFVRLDDPCVEGLIPLKLMGEDWYDYLEDAHVLLGERSLERIAAGMRLMVQLVEVNIVEGKLTFARVLDLDEKII